MPQRKNPDRCSHTGEVEPQVERRHYEDRISLQVSGLKSITTEKLIRLILSAETGYRVCNLTLRKRNGHTMSSGL